MTVDNSASFSSDSKCLIPCDVCGNLFKPRQKNSKHCSKLCNGRRKRYMKVNCIHCKAMVIRERRGANDSKLFCSRPCADKHRVFVTSEKEALKRIANKVKKFFSSKVSLELIKEIKSLKLIASNGKRKKLCKACGEIVYSKYVLLHPNCRKGYEIERKKRYKSTEVYKRLKKKYRSQRKAKQRGATIAESVDPIAILERDKWQCYLCGVDTPQDLRGSYSDNAPEVDHVIPLSKGGLHIESNLRCACRKCNALKSDQIYQVI